MLEGGDVEDFEEELVVGGELGEELDVCVIWVSEVGLARGYGRVAPCA